MIVCLGKPSDDPLADPAELALFEARRAALERELAQKREHLRYLEHKVAFWKAVQSGDDAKVREISEITTGLAKRIIQEK